MVDDAILWIGGRLSSEHPLLQLFALLNIKLTVDYLFCISHVWLVIEHESSLSLLLKECKMSNCSLLFSIWNIKEVVEEKNLILQEVCVCKWHVPRCMLLVLALVYWYLVSGCSSYWVVSLFNWAMLCLIISRITGAWTIMDSRQCSYPLILVFVSISRANVSSRCSFDSSFQFKMARRSWRGKNWFCNTSGSTCKPIACSVKHAAWFINIYAPLYWAISLFRQCHSWVTVSIS